MQWKWDQPLRRSAYIITAINQLASQQIEVFESNIVQRHVLCGFGMLCAIIVATDLERGEGCNLLISGQSLDTNDHPQGTT